MNTNTLIAYLVGSAAVFILLLLSPEGNWFQTPQNTMIGMAFFSLFIGAMPLAAIAMGDLEGSFWSFSFLSRRKRGSSRRQDPPSTDAGNTGTSPDEETKLGLEGGPSRQEVRAAAFSSFSIEGTFNQ